MEGALALGAPRAPSPLTGYSGQLLLRVENQFLHAPVQDFRDVQLVFRWARHFVNPAEWYHDRSLRRNAVAVLIGR